MKVFFINLKIPKILDLKQLKKSLPQNKPFQIQDIMYKDKDKKIKDNKMILKVIYTDNFLIQEF